MQEATPFRSGSLPCDVRIAKNVRDEESTQLFPSRVFSN